MTRRLEKLGVFTGFAEHLATLSTCKRNHVGCIIVPHDFSEVYALGYNGPPANEPNDACLDIPGSCGCIHAEANAIAKMSKTSDALLISTVCPCWHCAGLIINSKKISEVIYLTEYRDNNGLMLLKRHLKCNHLSTAVDLLKA